MTGVEGLTLFYDVMSKETERKLIKFLDTERGKDGEDSKDGGWSPITSSSKSRRVQHYGSRYDYRSGGFASNSFLSNSSQPNGETKAPPITGPLLLMTQRLSKLLQHDFNQIIVNEYLSGQGISPHTDDVRIFGDTIVTLSLGQPVYMEFSHHPKKDEKKDNKKDEKKHAKVWLPRRSLAVLLGDARYKYQHSISANKTLISPQGEKMVKSAVKGEAWRRVSITFRKRLD